MVRRRRRAPRARERRRACTGTASRWRPPHRFFRFRARARGGARSRARCAPDVVMERYYNFGGEGIAAAARARHPRAARGELAGRGSSRLAEGGPRRGAARAPAAALPRGAVPRGRARSSRRSPRSCPPSPAHKTETVTWGANVEAFSPDAARARRARARSGIPEGAVAVLFSGSFRPWHGVHVLRGRGAPARGIATISSSCSRAATPRGPARGYRGPPAGRACPTSAMPEVVAACDIGVAPYDTARLRQLALGFFWSPLKIFEYMASGLPTVTIPRSSARPRSCATARRGCTFRGGGSRGPGRGASSGSPTTPALRRRLGASARRAWSSATPGRATASSSRTCSLRADRAREDRPRQRGVPAARGRGGLVHARAGPRAARGRPRRDGRDHQPGAGGPRRPRVRRLVVRGPQAPGGARAPSRARLAEMRARRRPRPALAVRAGRAAPATARRGWRSPCATTGRSASGPRASARARCARPAACGP